MNGRTLVIVTTRLPPATCGIGTHSWLLRKHWPEPTPVEFLVIDGAAVANGVGGDRITEFGGQARELARQLERIGTTDVLLHYAARAYHRYGCPVWIPGVLAHWKRKFPRSRLMVFVHELHGVLPITSRHFWLGQVNAWIVRGLAATADVLVTNTEHHAARLRGITKRDDIHLFPVSSNIEPTAAFRFSQPRARTEFVLFGLSFGRLITLQKFAGEVVRWHARGMLTKLHIIGPEGDEFTRQADELIAHWPESIVIVRHGILPPNQVSRHLSEARFALTNVTPETWSKSGAFMACAAHRCAVVISVEGSAAGPLSHAVLAREVDSIPEAEINRRTVALADWYQTNADWPVIARQLASLFEKHRTT